MNRRLFINIFLFLGVCFLVIKLPVQAVSPTPEPEPGELCGWPDPDEDLGQTNQCCSAAEAELGLDELEGLDGFRRSIPCADLFFFELCPADAMDTAESFVLDNIFGGDDFREQLAEASPACKEYSFPSHPDDLLNENCICEPGVALDRPVSRLCFQYIVGGLTENRITSMNLAVANQRQQVLETLSQNEEFMGCMECFDNQGYWSALGCVSLANYQEFLVQTVFGILLGIAGMFALLCIIYASFQLQVSSGNAEKVNEARELVTSCIIGLLTIIFSVFILRVIGYDILRIPQFAPRAAEGEICREEGNKIAECQEGLLCPEENDATCEPDPDAEG
jgi:hypothetical protein